MTELGISTGAGTLGSTVCCLYALLQAQMGLPYLVSQSKT